MTCLRVVVCGGVDRPWIVSDARGGARMHSLRIAVLVREMARVEGSSSSIPQPMVLYHPVWYVPSYCTIQYNTVPYLTYTPYEQQWLGNLTCYVKIIYIR